MHFVLIHSPLVTKATWLALSACLETAGFQTIVVALDNKPARETSFFDHHIDQIEQALANLTNEKLIAVAHSGAGNLLALLDPARFEGHVFLDAVFPVAKASRFDLFDDPAAAQSWRGIANQNSGTLPQSMLTQFGKHIEDRALRQSFLADMSDVPIQLYEETIPVHPDWPRSKRGLYLLWTETYTADAARAQEAGFEVRRCTGSHFKMLNQPDEVAAQLAHFARIDR